MGFIRSASTSRREFIALRAEAVASYWSRLKTLDTNSYIDSNLGDAPQVVEIQPTDGAFKTENCQAWQKSD
jgi:hypothetical protein